MQRRLAKGISKIGTNYRESPIVVAAGERGGGPRAGDRMPDPELAASGRLSDHIGDGLQHCLLIYGGDVRVKEAARRVIETRGLADLVSLRCVGRADVSETRDYIHDATGTLHDAFGVKPRHNAMFLVRPDLYLAFAGRGDGEAMGDLISSLGEAIDRTFRRPPANPADHELATGAKPYAHGTA